MNSSKVKEDKEESKEFKIKPLTKKVAEEEIEEKVPVQKTQDAEKKRREFFSATIFDDEDSHEHDEKVDDDILNVPAFFRRKK